jgi:type I restriction enzyme S subunit
MKLVKTKKPVMASWIRELGHRLDAPPFLSGAIEARKAIESLPVRRDRLCEATRNGIQGVFHAGRLKRVWAADPVHGIPFLSGSDILQADFSNLPLFSRIAANTFPKLFIEEGWTLISRSATIGRLAYVRSDMAKCVCSEDVLRVVPDTNKIPPGFLYAFLSSKFGLPIITSGTYGSIIQHLEPEHITNLPVPRLGK